MQSYPGATELTLKLPMFAALAALALASMAPPAAARSAPSKRSAAVRQVTPPSLADAVAAVRAELRGIPQQGLVLGNSSSPVTVFEYADLICPPCAAAAASVVAPVIKRFVVDGSISIKFEPIVESPLSEQLALGAFAAGEQNLGWDYTQLAYLRSTPVSNGPLDSTASLAGALGLNLRLWRAATRRPLFPQMIEQAASVALIGGFNAYPVFVVRSVVDAFAPPFVRILRAPVTATQLSRTIRRALRGNG
jgi:protein-disulfide isomerase